MNEIIENIITAWKSSELESNNKLDAARIAFEKAKDEVATVKNTFSSTLMQRLGLNEWDKVTLQVHEYRDDSVHCFSAEQTLDCYIKRAYIADGYGKEDFVAPELYLKGKDKKFKKRPVMYSVYCSWSLHKDGVEIMSHKPESNVIEGTYSEEQLTDMRVRLKEHQKLS